MTDKKIFEESAKEIALFMYNVGITKKPEISFFKDDRGIFEKLFSLHMEDAGVLALKAVSKEVYLRVLGMHSFGAGAYIAAKEIDFCRSVAEFTAEEIEGVFKDFDLKDPYELALKKLGFAIDSGNRQMLDRVIVIGMKELERIAKDKAEEPENIKAFMQVLFNAGTSIYKLRKK